MITPALLRAYTATTYRVHAPGGDVAFEVERAAPQMDRLLAEHGCGSAAFITAFSVKVRSRALKRISPLHASEPRLGAGMIAKQRRQIAHDIADEIAESTLAKANYGRRVRQESARAEGAARRTGHANGAASARRGRVPHDPGGLDTVRTERFDHVLALRDRWQAAVAHRAA